MDNTNVGRRLIRLGCLPGCADAETTADGTPVARVVPLPSGSPPRRAPVELSRDKHAYTHLVTIAQYAELFQLSKTNVQAVVVQGLHLAETGQHGAVVSAASELTNTWALHTVSGTHSGVKQTMKDYVASIRLYCEWAETSAAGNPDGIIVPVNRNEVVAFLEVEKNRERSSRRRPAKRPRLTPPPRVARAAEGAAGDAREPRRDGATGMPRKDRPSPAAGVSAIRPSVASGGVTRAGSSAGTAAGPAADGRQGVRAAAGDARPHEFVGRGAGGGLGTAVGAGDRGRAAGAAAMGGPAGLGNPGRGGTAAVGPPRGGVAARTALPAAGQPGWVHGRRRDRAGQQGGAGGEGGGGSSDTEAAEVTGAAASSTTSTTAAAPYKVGPSTLKILQSAMAKVATVFNGLCSQCLCGACDAFRADTYLPAGGCRAAKAVVDQCARERYLEATAAGVGKATGARDPALPDDVRLSMVKEMLLGSTRAMEFHAGLELSALFLLAFSLEARGATMRGLTWSDLVIRHFPSMFSAKASRDGSRLPLDVLCTSVFATKTKENTPLCLGSLPHVNPWFCPFGAVADALVAAWHRPSEDDGVPPVNFAPDFNPTDESLMESGVEPRFFRASGAKMGQRKWYWWPIFRAMRGANVFKPITYDKHLDRLKRVANKCGVPEKTALTHATRSGAAQKAMEAGATEADNNKHGQWGPGPGDGAYNGDIPDPLIVLLLSGRTRHCVSPVTARLTVEVLLSLQQTVCPWLEDVEKAYVERLKGGSNFRDVALTNLFKLTRLARSVFFQSWAARLNAADAPDGAYVTRHPLLRNEEFERFRAAAGFAAESGEEAAGEAAAAVLPQLGEAVKAAAEATATSAAGNMLYMERALSLQADAVAEAAEANRVATVTDLSAKLDAVMALVGDLAARLDRGGGSAAVRGGACSSVPSLPFPPPSFPLPSAPASTGSHMSPECLPSPSDGVASAVAPHAAGVAAAPAPRIALSGSVGVSPALLRDRESVRRLRMTQKLKGVEIFNGPGECVPLLKLEFGASWSRSLDEYATGLDGVASVREVEALFGQRWLHLVADPLQRNRLGHHYSTRAPIYRAFNAEFALRGAAVGVDVIVKELKDKYRGIRGSSAVYKQAAIDYPKPS